MSFDQAFSLMFEASDKRSADSGTSYLNDFFSVFSGSNSSVKTTSANYKGSLKLPAVYNAVDQISNDIAKIPFGVFASSDGSRERLRNHAADRLISIEPNAIMTTFVERKMMAVSLLLRGNALSKIEFGNDGWPKSLTFINWDDVNDVKTLDNEILYYVRGYKKPLLSSEVLHFKNFSHNGIVGVSVITYAAIQMNLAIEIQNFSSLTVQNKGLTRGVVETEKAITKDGVKKAISASISGALADKSADRIAVLDDGLKYKSISITPQEAQIVEMSRFTIEDIARWFNIAPHKIKSLQQSTNNNIEQQSLDHSSDTIQPYITNFEQEYSKKLLTDKERVAGTKIKGNMNVLLRADLKTRGQWYAWGINFGYLNRNQVREFEDMDKGPALLDEYLTPANAFTEEQIKKNLKKEEDE